MKKTSQQISSYLKSRILAIIVSAVFAAATLFLLLHL